MTETVQDVFDELWNRYELVCNNFEFEIGQGCPSGPIGLSAYDVTIRQRFLKALKAESKEQQKCQYCHKPHRIIPTDDEFGWGGESGNFLRIGMTGGDSWNGIPPNPTPGGAIHTVMAVGYDNAEVDETISIKYCPMCGRRLEAEK